MGVLKNYLLFFRILNRLFALVGFPCGLEVYRMAEIIAVVENVDNGAGRGRPDAGHGFHPRCHPDSGPDQVPAEHGDVFGHHLRETLSPVHLPYLPIEISF